MCGCGRATAITARTASSRGLVKGQPVRFLPGHQLRSIDRRQTAHGGWKGTRVGYSALHKWVRKYKPKRCECEWCGRQMSRTHMANISGRYRRDVDDYLELCPSCHYRFDHDWGSNSVAAV